MKKYIFLIISIIALAGCQDVIDVDLNEAEERLVIEAAMIKLKGASGTNQRIRLTKTRGFFEDSLTIVDDAEVTVTGQGGEVFTFEHDSAGYYYTNQFQTNLLENYYLKVEVDGEIYTAEETFMPVVPIDSVSQRSNAGFSGEDIELKAFYKDPAGEENYYLFTFFVNFVDFPTTEIYDDEFTDGNTIFALYQEEELMPGDDVIITNFGLSRQFYEYMNVLLSQVGSIGGPFQTQPAVVRGNIINETNPDNFPYGYFSLTESDQFIYTVQDE
jgi:hypothetical protein